MAIQVEYGNTGQGGTFASAMAQAGVSSLNREYDVVMQANRLEAAREGQEVEIAAKADAARVKADNSMALVAVENGLSEQLKVNEFNREISLQRQKAKDAANKFETEFTARQRQEIAKLNNSRTLIETSEFMSDEEKQVARQMIDLKEAGIEPSSFPADRNKVSYPKGQGDSENSIWEGKDGVIYGYDRSGSVREVTKASQTREGIRLKAEQDIELARINSEAKLAEKAFDAYAKLLTTKRSVLRDGMNVDEFMSSEEAMAAMGPLASMLPGGLTEESKAQLEEAAAVDAVTQDEAWREWTAKVPTWASPQWVMKAYESGIEIKQADSRLGEKAGTAQAIVRSLGPRSLDGDGLSSREQSLLNDAIEVMLSYTEKGK